MNDAQLPDPTLQPVFDELARLVLADHSLDTVMTVVSRLAKEHVPGASEVSVTLVDRGRSSTVAYTGELALHMDERQYAKGYGPCLDCIDGGEPVLIRDMGSEQRWPDWAAEGQRRGLGSSLSIPVPLQREVSAALNIYSTSHDAFSDDDVVLAKTFAAYAGVALANMHLHEARGRVAEQLQEAMDGRAVIEQAKGVLMAQQRCSAEAAFNLLVAESQRSNRKLREIAAELVARVSEAR